MIEKITLKCKNLLLFIVAIFLTSQLFSQTKTHTIFYENFDANNGGWISTTKTGKVGSWTYDTGTTLVAEGGYWRCNPFSNYSNNSYIYLTNPTAISTIGFTDVTIYLDIRYNLNYDLDDGMQLQYTTDATGLTGWTRLGSNGDGNNWYNRITVNAIATNEHGWSDINVENSTSNSKFIEASLQAGVLNNQASLRFRLVFASDASNIDQGVAVDNIVIKGNPIIPFTDPANGPASVNTNLKLWLKTNSGTSTTTDNTPLLIWNDQAYDNHAKSYGSSQPLYKNNGSDNINFNPVIDFTRANANVLKGKGGFWSHDYWIVVQTKDIFDKTTSNSQTPLSGRINDTGFSVDGTSISFARVSSRFNSNNLISNMIGSYNNSTAWNATPAADSYGRSYAPATVNSLGTDVMILNVKSNKSVTPNVAEIYYNGKRIDNHTGTTGLSGTGNPLIFTEITNMVYAIGAGRYTLNGHALNSYLDGKITEVISYSNSNSILDQLKIQSYLAIKNGVTLKSFTSSKQPFSDECDVNYIDSQGGIIWNTAANTGFNYDIAGIGRDDASALNQKQSKSVNTNDDITIGLTTIATTNTANTNTFGSDKDFLVWGNNHGTLNAITPVVVNMSDGITPALITNVEFVSVGRTWKVVENTTGDIPSCKVSIPTTMLSNTLSPPGSYLMFISDTPNFDPTADYRVMTESGGNLYTDYDFDGIKYITFGFAPEKLYERSIYFDGVKDYVDMENALNLNPSEFTISAWIKRDANSINRSILSKRDAAYTEGYDFRITSANKLEMSWGNLGAQKITSNTTIPQDKWHHVAIIYSGGTANLYIDGVFDKSAALTAPVATTQSFYIAAAGKGTPVAYFKGNIDEVRIWNIALSANQLRYIMNQELIDKTVVIPPLPLIRGNVIPTTITKNEISAIPWSALAGYYPMSVYTYTNTNDASGNGHQGALRKLNTVDRQTAPLPYVSIANTNWDLESTWVNGAVQTIPGAASLVNSAITVDWNIVQINSDVTMDNALLPPGNKEERSVLGLFINGSKKLTVDGLTNANYGSTGTGNGLKVTHYLNLAGTLDLQGESQLIQTDRSILESSATGNLERDQQGTLNSFNYNYWTSSVGQQGAGIDLRNNFTIKNTLNDGTNPASPVAISFNPSITWADNPYSGNKRISTRWLYKFYGKDNDYNSWIKIDQNTSLKPGEGYSMKGTSGATAIGTTFQNYVFKGLPYNGDFTLPLVKGTGYVPANPTGDVDRLIGNPYPSALDANLFILDNLSTANGGTNTNGNIFNGALYFWDHFGQKDSHILKAYVGGYATRNLTTGVKAQSTDARINNDNSWGDKTPGQYIPVNQAFFVITTLAGFKDGNNDVLTSINGGNIVFKNSQRVFQKESLPIGSSVFMKAEKTNSDTAQKNEAVDEVANPIIRLMFDSPTGYHRQIAIGAVENTTNHFDIGYDAFIADVGPEDMYWTIQEAKFVIQGVPVFDDNQEFPLGLKIAKTGLARIKIDALENMDENISVYIKDKLLGKTHNISQNPFEIALEPGTYTNRFTVTFKMQKLVTEDVAVAITEETQMLATGIQVFMNNDIGELQLKNTGDTGITSMALYNYLGQTMKTWNSNLDRRTVSLPINVVTGVYLLQINTKTSVLNTKIIVE